MPAKTVSPTTAAAEWPIVARSRKSESPKLTPQAVPPTGLVERLQQGIDRLETASRVGAGDRISSGCAAIDRLLPGGGYRPGGLVQWLTRAGCGADYLSLRTAVEACRAGGVLVVVDPWRQFYPPTAAAMGVPMSNLVILRPGSREPAASHGSDDWRWAMEQALRCSAVAAVWGALGPIDSHWFRRFQLSAEASGCLGLLVQSIAQRGQPTWADVQWVAGPGRGVAAHLEPSAARQHVRWQLTRCRGGRSGKTVELSIDPVDGSVTTWPGRSGKRR